MAFRIMPTAITRRAADAHFEYFLSRLDNVSRSGDQWSARCPAHDDNENSLSVGQKEDGEPLIHCHAGCEFEDILTAIELTPGDLRAGSGANGSVQSKPKSKIVAEYDYRNADGSLDFQVVRYSPKKFKQRRPNPDRPDS